MTANPLQKAFEDYHIMADELATAQDQIRTLMLTNTDLLREGDFTRAKLAKVTSERDRLQAYAIELTSRLGVIEETIIAAKQAAVRHAVEQTEQKPAPVTERATELPKLTF
ncbi:hypothetical protein [Bradyrhizobium sp. S3.7.6]